MLHCCAAAKHSPHTLSPTAATFNKKQTPNGYQAKEYLNCVRMRYLPRAAADPEKGLDLELFSTKGGVSGAAARSAPLVVLPGAPGSMGNAAAAASKMVLGPAGDVESFRSGAWPGVHRFVSHWCANEGRGGGHKEGSKCC